MTRTPVIDCLQFANWSEEVFREMRAGGVHAVHATILYHGTFREMVREIEAFNAWFATLPDLIFHGRTGDAFQIHFPYAGVIPGLDRQPLSPRVEFQFRINTLCISCKEQNGRETKSIMFL